MANELSNLKPAAGAYKKRTRLGRGEGSGKGKTAGRGSKGQHKRGTVAPGFEGGQMPLHRRLPKRGFNNIFAKEFTVVRLDRIAERFAAGDVVDAESLKARGLIKKVGKNGIKILGNGEIGVALTVKAARFTASAEEKITSAGGTVERV
ncbi:MAG: 50S ribosomal protein L15 [Myxococcota bacterium]|nr:50S ribosomal protein L15 [Myxococcota bacterium]